MHCFFVVVVVVVVGIIEPLLLVLLNKVLKIGVSYFQFITAGGLVFRFIVLFDYPWCWRCVCLVGKYNSQVLGFMLPSSANQLNV